MEHKKLVIDDEFKHLIRPLKRKEFLQLEENLLRDGCRDPIVVWNDVIVDGHNRYEICTRHGIPFYTKVVEGSPAFKVIKLSRNTTYKEFDFLIVCSHSNCRK